MCAAGTMPGELHKLWQAAAGRLPHGIRLFLHGLRDRRRAWASRWRDPTHEVICMVGDGSYMMANSELATAVMRRMPFTVVLTDNRGYGCINRLQQGTGGAEFNNMSGRQLSRATPRRSTSSPMPPRWARMPRRSADIADLEARIVAAPRPRHPDGDRHRHRPGARRPRPAATGGTSRCPKVGGAEAAGEGPRAATERRHA